MNFEYSDLCYESELVGPGSVSRKVLRRCLFLKHVSVFGGLPGASEALVDTRRDSAPLPTKVDGASAGVV